MLTKEWGEKRVGKGVDGKRIRSGGGRRKGRCSCGVSSQRMEVKSLL